MCIHFLVVHFLGFEQTSVEFMQIWLALGSLFVSFKVVLGSGHFCLFLYYKTSWGWFVAILLRQWCLPLSPTFYSWRQQGPLTILREKMIQWLVLKKRLEGKNCIQDREDRRQMKIQNYVFSSMWINEIMKYLEKTYM